MIEIPDFQFGLESSFHNRSGAQGLHLYWAEIRKEKTFLESLSTLRAWRRRPFREIAYLVEAQIVDIIPIWKNL